MNEQYLKSISKRFKVGEKIQIKRGYVNKYPDLSHLNIYEILVDSGDKYTILDGRNNTHTVLATHVTNES